MEDQKSIELRWRKIQSHLGFSDEELDLFRSNPKYKKCIENAPLFRSHIIVIDVIEAIGCTAGYKAGDQFHVDGQGCIIKEKSPPQLCVAAIWAIKPLMDRMWEAFFNNSTDVFHDTVRCPDVGVQRGGAGEVTFRVRAVSRQQMEKQ